VPETSEVLACLVAAAVFKTVASDVESSMGGFDSHALPLKNQKKILPIGCYLLHIPFLFSGGLIADP
jgi:hypothetical protein